MRSLCFQSKVARTFRIRKVQIAPYDRGSAANFKWIPQQKTIACKTCPVSFYFVYWPLRDKTSASEPSELISDWLLALFRDFYRMQGWFFLVNTLNRTPVLQAIVCAPVPFHFHTSIIWFLHGNLALRVIFFLLACPRERDLNPSRHCNRSIPRVFSLARSSKQLDKVRNTISLCSFCYNAQ